MVENMNTHPESFEGCENCRTGCFAEDLIRGLASVAGQLSSREVAYEDPHASLVRGVHGELLKACKVYQRSSERTEDDEVIAKLELDF